MAKIEVRSDIAGMVWVIEKTIGDPVKAGDTVVILESMKMEIPVEAPQAGTIDAIMVASEDTVDDGQVLFVIEV